jgi:hypothetical protein
MKKRPRQYIAATFTYEDSQAFKNLFDALEGVYGEAATGYFKQYVKLWPHYQKLKNIGVNVRIASPRLGRRPLIVIDR